MSNLFQRWRNRASAEEIPEEPEIERFGADGEELVYGILAKAFDTVIRSPAVPHKELFLEKDFLVIHQGFPFLLEVKHWKGEVGQCGDKFYQQKENGIRKTIKSPAGTTAQFLRQMRSYYHLKGQICGMVVFSEPSCKLALPREIDGIAMLPLEEAVSFIRSYAKAHKGEGAEFSPEDILRCTRFYSREREFCKGILATNYIECFTEDGSAARLDTLQLRFLSVEPQPLRLRDKLYVTFSNGSSGVFYNRDTVLTVAVLDGSYRKIALNRIQHIVF
ncbi:MAG: NERD domain-containing protein [Clostridia bacterium]|nr:NERD domain-containing protein [Clostridia bacterium]MBQ5833289.1 NERD domain-containing protein [Clostridia bacterium]